MSAVAIGVLAVSATVVMFFAIRATDTRRGALYRMVAFLAVLLLGGSQVLAHTPGGQVAALAAFGLYVCAVTAVRVALWGWRD